MSEKIAFNSAGFFHWLMQNKLMGCRNRTSGKFYLPPRPVCSVSYTDDMEWEEVSGNGEIAAFTVITVAPTHMIEAGYGRDKPYCAGFVRLAEGPMVSAQILGVDLANPENIKIGTPVKLKIIERGTNEAKRNVVGFEVS